MATPQVYVDPGMMQISRPGFDASDDTLTPSRLRFSTRFRALGILTQVNQFNGGGSVQTFPLVDAPHPTPPLVRRAMRMPANFFGMNGGDSNECIVFTEDQGWFVSNRTAAVNVRSDYAYHVALSTVNNAFIDPIARRVLGGLGPSAPGWIFVFRVPEHQAVAGAGGLYMGAEGGDPALKVALPGHNPKTAGDSGLYYSSDWDVLTVIQEGSVDLVGGPSHVDVSIPNMGYKPLVFCSMKQGIGCVRHTSNANIRFYKNWQTGEPDAVYANYSVFAVPFPGAP